MVFCYVFVMDYKKLIVWQKSFKLSLMIYKITTNFPKNEMFGLISQLRRCSISIPSNIAEGYSRISSKSFLNFLKISLGSSSELETQILISNEIGYLKDNEMKETIDLLIEVQKMLGALIKKHNSS
jgi:four helix bundle protein